MQSIKAQGLKVGDRLFVNGTSYLVNEVVVSDSQVAAHMPTRTHGPIVEYAILQEVLVEDRPRVTSLPVPAPPAPESQWSIKYNYRGAFASAVLKRGTAVVYTGSWGLSGEMGALDDLAAVIGRDIERFWAKT